MPTNIVLLKSNACFWIDGWIRILVQVFVPDSVPDFHTKMVYASQSSNEVDPYPPLVLHACPFPPVVMPLPLICYSPGYVLYITHVSVKADDDGGIGSNEGLDSRGGPQRRRYDCMCLI
jgi:hypothetical protein